MSSLSCRSFYLFDDEPQLLFDLIVRTAVTMSEMRVCKIEDGKSLRSACTRAAFPRSPNINFRQIHIVVGAALNGGGLPGPRGKRLCSHDTLPAFDRDPLQEVDQPARRDRLHHGDRLGGQSQVGVPVARSGVLGGTSAFSAMQFAPQKCGKARKCNPSRRPDAGCL